MKLLTGISGLFAPLAVMAQLESPVPIVLEGSTNADRQVKGSELPTAPDHGASAEAVRSQAVQWATASGTNTLTGIQEPGSSSFQLSGCIVRKPVPDQR